MSIPDASVYVCKEKRVSLCLPCVSVSWKKKMLNRQKAHMLSLYRAEGLIPRLLPRTAEFFSVGREGKFDVYTHIYMYVYEKMDMYLRFML